MTALLEAWGPLCWAGNWATWLVPRPTSALGQSCSTQPVHLSLQPNTSQEISRSKASLGMTGMLILAALSDHRWAGGDGPEIQGAPGSEGAGGQVARQWGE